MKPKREDADQPAPDQAPAPLVPLYGSTDIVRGIQAIRRGDAVLYTVRGEPAEVRELMKQLDREGVGEVVALISHHIDAEAPYDEGEPEDIQEED